MRTKVKLLTPEEETALGNLSMQGDRAAQGELVRRNVPLAIATANMLCRKWNITHLRDDCGQEACLGLMKAANSFDPSKGKFSTYAVLWIKTYIQKWFSRETRHPIVSMNAPLPFEETGEYQDFFATDDDSPEDNVISMERHRLVRHLVNKLGSKGILHLQKVAEFRFLEEKTLEETGELIGRTRERSRQIEFKAMEKLSRWALRYNGGIK